MPHKKYPVPLWSLLYPELLDKEYLIQTYARCKNQVETAKEIGCGVRTLRNALRYHGLKKPFIVRND